MRKFVIRCVAVSVAAAMAVPMSPISSVSAVVAGQYTKMYRGAGRQAIADLVVNRTNGDVYVIGTTSSKPDATNVITDVDDAPNSYAFVSKITMDGQVAWTKRVGAGNVDYLGNKLAIDSSGKLYALVTLRGRAAGSKYMVAVHKFSSAGAWEKTMSVGSPDGEEYGYGIDVMNSVVAIAYSTTGNIAGAQGGKDMAVTTFDSSTGAKIKSVQIGSRGADVPYGGLSFRADSTLILAGSTTGILNNTVNRTQFRQDEDNYAIRLSAVNLARLASRQWGSTSHDRLTSVVASGRGTYYVGGQTLGTLPGSTSAGGIDSFISGMDSNMALLWTKIIGSPGDDLLNRVRMDPVTNEVQYVGTTTGVLFSASAGESDFFSGKLTMAGEYSSSRQFGTTKSEVGTALDLRSDGSQVLGGVTYGTFDSSAAIGMDSVVISTGVKISEFTQFAGNLTTVPKLTIPSTAVLGITPSGTAAPGATSPDAALTSGEEISVVDEPLPTVTPKLCNEQSSPSVHYRRFVATCAGLAVKKGTTTRIRLSKKNAAGVCSLSPRKRLKLNKAGTCKVRIRATQANGSTKALWITYTVS